MNSKPPSSASRPSEPSTPWEIGTDVDVQVAMAVSRAATRAMMSLSPNAESLVRDALATEIDALQERADPLSLAAASNLLAILNEAA